VESTGNSARVSVGSELGKVRVQQRADLLEEPLDDPGRRNRAVDLHGYQVATVRAHLEVPRLTARAAPLAPDAEVSQPLYARYWLHNRGPAALGGLPVVAHLHPQSATAEPGDEVVLRLTAVSDCSDATLSGIVAMVCPDDWKAEPAEKMFTLGAGEHGETAVKLTIPEEAQPGPYPVRAQLRITDSEAPKAWRQVVEDVCIVQVGAPQEAQLVCLVGEPVDVTLATGDTARLTVTVASHACADLALEAHLISPWGTWEWIGPAALGTVLPARGTVELGFDVAPPVWLEPGQWWALVRIGCAGRLLYSPAVRVTLNEHSMSTA
jgi:alpha-mannosidase